MRHYKNIEEQAIFDLFRSLMADFPKGKTVRTESPDFIVRLSVRKSLGIEITKLISPAIRNVIMADEIQQRIGAKNSKLSHYASSEITEFWLLIAIGFDPLNKDAKLSQSALNHCYSTAFERVFLLDVPHKKLYMVNKC